MSTPVGAATRSSVWQRVLEMVGRPLIALAVALVLGGVVIALAQKSITAPFASYAALLTGAFGDANAIAGTLRQATPLLLTGIGVSVALAAGLFNIGAEGQMAVGALTAAVVAASLPGVPVPFLLVLSLLVGFVAGGIWAFLPAYLKIKRGTHEVITAILLNYIAQNTTRYLSSVPLKDPAGQVPQTREASAYLPRLLPSYDVHWGLFVGLIAVALVAFALSRTVWGYETRAVGRGVGAAEAAGIPVASTQIKAFLLSGALAGLAGAVTVLGEVPFRRFPADFYGVGYGFDGLAVALLGAPGGYPAPWAILPSALLFGALNSGAEAMAFNVETPRQIVSVVQAILIVAIGARLVMKRRAKAKAAGGTQ